MPLATIVAGPYTSAYNSDSLGHTEDGFQVSYNFEKLPVKVDFYGDSIIDNVYRGVNGQVTVVGMEYSTITGGSPIVAVWPYGALGAVGVVGRMDVGSSLSAALVLTSTTGTTAAAAPATLTSSNSIISPQSVQMMFAARERKVPVTFDLMIYDNAGTVVLFVLT